MPIYDSHLDPFAGVAFIGISDVQICACCISDNHLDPVESTALISISDVQIYACCIFVEMLVSVIIFIFVTVLRHE